jgi:glycosyltransferase involved in cell wall biosynthesis
MTAVFAKELQRRGIEVELAYCVELPVEEARITDELTQLGIRVHHVPNLTKELLPFGARPLSRLIHERKIDLISSSHVRDMPPAMLAAHRTGIDSLPVCHNLPNFNGNPLARRIKNELYRRGLSKHANHIIVVAPAIKNTLVSAYRISPNRITVVTCAIDLATAPRREPSIAARLRQEFSYSGSEFVAVNVARIHRQKGQDILIDSLALLKKQGRLPENFRTLFVGGCENKEGETRLRWHQQQVQAHDLTKHIHFTGFRADCRDFLSLADIFILPSRWEGLPLAVLESFAARVPVLMTNYGEPLESFRDGVDGGYVATENPAALADGIARFLSLSPEQRQLMGENGRRYLEQHLSLDRSLKIFGDKACELLGV